MGRCRYCGENAGLFKSQHGECQQANISAYINLKETAYKTSMGSISAPMLNEQKQTLVHTGHLRPEQVHKAIIEGWSSAVEDALANHELSEQEEAQLTTSMKILGLTQHDLGNSYELLVKGAVLREIDEGKVPSRLRINDLLPFNFQKSEQLVWLFQDVDYYEQKVIRERTGRSQGVSFRVAKGVYVRTGGFNSRPVERIVTDHVDTGLYGDHNQAYILLGRLQKISCSIFQNGFN